MRILILFCLSTVVAFEAAAPVQAVPSNPAQVNQSQDGSLLQPDDRAYVDAMEFARLLNQSGIQVKSLHRSKLESFFQGIEKAAFFRTEKGVVEVVFFPDPHGAENVSVTERHQAGRYLYSFQGQPNPRPNDGFDGSRPIYFLMHRNWFIVVGSEELYGALKKALNRN